MSALSQDNSYTLMQRVQYERDADLMNEQNHMFHNANQDYWDILVAETETGFREKTGFDFGCGCGRNLQNLWYRFNRIDGVDISKNNLKHAEENLLKAGCPKDRFNLYHCNGIDLNDVPSAHYDFVMSTIVLQHIAVYDIRLNYFKEFFRILKPEGLLSFQMGFGNGYGKAGYYDNHYDAEGTNSLYDTTVSDPQQIIDDLTKIGFAHIEYTIRQPYSDGHPEWIFVKARKIKQDTNVFVFADPVDLNNLSQAKVSYQAAQFLHMKEFSNTILAKDISKVGDAKVVVLFDEFTLLTDERLKELKLSDEQLLVYISHDYWCHPLKVADSLKRFKNVLMILRHYSAKTIFDHLLPHIHKIVQRPGVETSIFHPCENEKKYDILIGGSETPDYPIRQKLNRIVREFQSKYNWNVLDLTGKGLMSNPPGVQFEYAPSLAASKISPTATNRGGASPSKIALQYFDFSPARAQFDHPFYGLKIPELSQLEFNTAGITPRYLESLASKSLLIGDLPQSDYQKWYEDKMIVINESQSDNEIAEIMDYWIHNDEERGKITSYAFNEVIKSETSKLKALELINLINSYLLDNLKNYSEK